MPTAPAAPCRVSDNSPTKRVMRAEATAFERDGVESFDGTAQETKKRRIQDDDEEEVSKEADERSEVSEPARRVAEQADECSEVSEPPRRDPSGTIDDAQPHQATMDSALSKGENDGLEQREESMAVEDAADDVPSTSYEEHVVVEDVADDVQTRHKSDQLVVVEDADDVPQTRDSVQSERILAVQDSNSDVRQTGSLHRSEERLVRCGRALRDASARLVAYAERLGCADVRASVDDVAGHVESVLHELQGDEEYTQDNLEEEQVRSKRRLSIAKSVAKQKKTATLDGATRHPLHNWWSVLWQHLMKAHGWKWKRGKGVVDWYYLRPGCPWPADESRLGHDYFDSVAAMYEVADRENLWALVDGSAAKQSPAHSAKKRRPKNERRSSTAKRSRPRGDDDEWKPALPESTTRRSSRELSEPLRELPNDKFNLTEAWRQCEREGWTYAWTRGYLPSSYAELFDVVWVKPGVTRETALVDYNVFLTHEAVKEHLRNPQPTLEEILNWARVLDDDVATRLTNGELDLEEARRWLAKATLEQETAYIQNTDPIRTTRRHNTA